MSQSFYCRAMLVAILVPTWTAGCNQGPAPSGTQPAAAPPTVNAPADPASSDPAASDSDMASIEVELAKLAPEDAASAKQQRMCPVSDEMLGSMGPPLKVDVNGKPVWICCEGCRNELTANADKYLAKLKP